MRRERAPWKDGGALVHEFGEAVLRCTDLLVDMGNHRSVCLECGRGLELVEKALQQHVPAPTLTTTTTSSSSSSSRREVAGPSPLRDQLARVQFKLTQRMGLSLWQQGETVEQQREVVRVLQRAASLLPAAPASSAAATSAEKGGDVAAASAGEDAFAHSRHDVLASLWEVASHRPGAGAVRRLSLEEGTPGTDADAPPPEETGWRHTGAVLQETWQSILSTMRHLRDTNRILDATRFWLFSLSLDLPLDLSLDLPLDLSLDLSLLISLDLS